MDMIKITRLNTDILVVGGGLAGLCAALRARERGCGVLLVSKGRAGRSGNTIMARNNMAAVMDRNNEALEKHVQDTMAGGACINDRELVSVLARGAREAVLWLVERGVPVRREKGKFLRKGSPGHSEERILTVEWSALGQSRTPGLALTLPLLRRALEQGVELVENLLVADLVVKQNRVVGAYGFQRGRPELVIISCRAVVLACGGAGRLYPLTTNTADVTGDGYALAHQAGAGLRDMEFIQFLPTVTLDPLRMAISSSPFADGAVLRNRYGENFMPRYSPLGCMATRDLMARAVFEEVRAGRGTARGGVFMDFAGVPQGVMQSRYSDILEYLRGRTAVEVAPAAHFTMGGVIIDTACRTTVTGLYACGEVAGGVHGANRLASNALTEAAVFGLLAGDQAAGETGAGAGPGLTEGDIKEIAGDCGMARVSIFGDREEDVFFKTLLRRLRELMGRHAGLLRSRAGLLEARGEMAGLKRKLEGYPVTSYRGLVACHQAGLMLTTASLIVEAAMARQNSIGAHFRVD